MKNLKHILLLLLLALFFISCSDDDPVDTNIANSYFTQQSLLDELNLARTSPNEYADLIEANLQYFDGLLYSEPGQVTIQTNEGKEAAVEAVNFLRSQAPVGALSISNGLAKAAQYHADEQSKTGATGHNSQNGETPFDRMEKFGTATGTRGENITYGPNSARRVIMSFIIDDGVPDRGHRKNIFEPNYKVVGHGYNSHPTYRLVIVQKLATAFADKVGA